ncbi:MAG: hypothetical protein GY751_22360 [Bacteroidetes bacterium]|nr:hypothetical protein [Bacteroidota bacterium]
MSVLKNFKSIFIVEEEKKKAPAAKKQTTKEQKSPTSTKSTTRKTSATPGKQDDKIINALFKALEDNNLNGFDYIEFKRSVKGLEKMVADEATRFKSAFSTASTMGVTLDKLVETASYYVKILDKERDQFVKAAGDQTTSLVENRKKEMQQMLKGMAEKKAMIEKLNKELKSSEGRLQKLQEGIDTATVKIEETKKNFDVSFTHLKGQIQQDIEKMTNFLK